MIISYIIGLGTGFLVSFCIYWYINTRNIKANLNRIEKNKKYVNSVSNQIQELIGMMINYIEQKSPSALLKREVIKVLKRESQKWGVKKNGTNSLWTDIGNNISNSTDSSNRKVKSDN